MLRYLSLSKLVKNITSDIVSSNLIQKREFRLEFKKAPGTKGVNTHRSKRAKEGLFHGKDIRSGNQISHSEMKTKRKWKPNVIDKRVWSIGLKQWVKFKMTTSTLKAIDYSGGIDNYIMELDEISVKDSKKNTAFREKIAALWYHQGKLSDVKIRKFGYELSPPPLPEVLINQFKAENEGEKILDISHISS